LDLSKLQELGAFIPRTEETEEITWTRKGPDGQDVSTILSARIRRLSGGATEQLYSEINKHPDRASVATVIQQVVLLGDEGETALSYQQAYDLEGNLQMALYRAVQKVNPLVGVAAKN
jgi:hypothetical protein